MFFLNKILLNSNFECIKRKSKLQNKKDINKVLQIILSIKGEFPKARNLSEMKMRFSDQLKLNNNKFKHQKVYNLIFYRFNGNHQRLEINSIHNRFLSFGHHCYLYIESVRCMSIHS